MTDRLRRVPWEEITTAHLQMLVEDEVREGRSIEYKQEAYDGNDAGTREFLADVTSFANAAGGHLIIGIVEDDGLPVSIPGIDAAADALVQVLDSKLQASVDPRVLGVTMKAVPVDDDRFALVIRVPQSWNRPHMVTFKNLSRCYSRNNAGKFQMDMTEIRTQVLGGSAMADRMDEFRRERVRVITQGEGPVRTLDGAKLILHVVPFLSLEFGSWQGLPERNAIFQFLSPLGGHGWSDRINFDGLLTYSEQGQVTGSYLQLFRQGMVETVNADLLAPRDGSRNLYGEYIDTQVEGAVERISHLLNALEAAPPIAWMLTLTGVRDYEIKVQNTFPSFTTLAIDRDEVSVPEVIDVDMTLTSGEIAQRLMDPVWQAGGWPRSRTFERRERAQE